MTFSRSPFRLGLTGGIGSGKSTVAQMLAARGACVIDADVISRNLTAPNGAALPAIATAFGAEFIDTHGALHREKMRALVFANEAAKKTLEAIIHPLVAMETERQTRAALKAGHQTLVFDIPLLVESGRWRNQLDRVLVIDCAESTQIERVMARSQLTSMAIEKIMAGQAPRSIRLKAADWVISNDHISLAELERCIATLPLAPSKS